MKLRNLAPVTFVVVSGACFATRNDVRILQEDIHALRAQELRADSARARQIADMTAALAANIGIVKDSVRDLGTRLTTFQGATRQEFYSMGQQLLMIGEAMNMSQAQLRNFRADIEERNRQAMETAMRSAAAPPAAAGDSANAVTAPATVVPLTEGPNTLYQIGQDQMNQNSWSAARDAFTQLLTAHPNSDLAPYGQLRIAESFDNEGNRTEGDSAFRLVVTKYPSSPAAPTALYKLGRSLKAQRKNAEARAAMQQVVRNYPRSDEATLATEWLAQNPPS
jgi:tol-pal system protein YbgF